MDTLLTLIREWNPAAQWLFLFLISLFLTIVATLIFTTFETFINRTLPILVRGWPPGYKDDEEEENVESSSD